MCVGVRCIDLRRVRERICEFMKGREDWGMIADKRNSKVYVSFGGLLLYLEGPYKKLTPLRIDYVYLLIKK